MIPHIVADFGREFRFPLDTKLLPTSTLNPEKNQALFKYLRDVSMNSKFAISALKIITEERITEHRECWNKGKMSISFQSS